jgi:hypothetical protein
METNMAINIRRSRKFLISVGAILLSGICYHAEVFADGSVSEKGSLFRIDGEKTMNAELIQKRGKELREALDKKFNSLRATNDFHRKPDGIGLEADVTEVVSPFIPAGTDFESAEKILRAAGFEILPRPSSRRTKDLGQKPGKWDGVMATINPYSTIALTKFSLYITLIPQAMDYVAIERTDAAFLASTP